MVRFIERKLYRNIVGCMPIVSIDVVLFDKDLNKTLLFKRTNKPLHGEYYTIGGRMNKGESPIEGAIRKMKEELNISINQKDIKFIDVINELFDDCEFDICRHNVNLYFAFVDKENILDTIILDEQHCGCQWFKVSEIYNLHPYIVEKIKNSVSLLN